MELQYVGKNILKEDAYGKVLGTSEYPNDIEFSHMLFAGVVRSSIPFGKILKIDYEKALSMDKVVKIITSDMIPGEKYHGVVLKDQPVLTSTIVKRVGDPIIIIVAEDKESLKEAIESVQITYEEYKGVFSIDEALKEDAPRLGVKDNILYTLKVKKGNIEEGIKKSKYIAENIYETKAVDHGFLQPEAAVSKYENNILSIYVATQYAHYDREEIGRCLNIPLDKVHVINTAIGGAFGGREDISLQLHASLAAYYTKKPVKIVYDREESTIAHCKRHPVKMHYKTGCDESGKLTFQKVRIFGDTGAYCSWGMNVLRKAAVHASGPYNIENIDIESYAVYTNNSFSGAMRGFGAIQAAFGYESQINILSRKSGIHPLKFMLLNCFKEGQSSATGQFLKGVSISKCIEAMMKVEDIEVLK